jgi:hypothetical protein
MVKNCQNCGAKYNGPDKSKYCSNGCKQKSYRDRHGLETPVFLKKPETPSPAKERFLELKKTMLPDFSLSGFSDSPQVAELKRQKRELVNEHNRLVQEHFLLCSSSVIPMTIGAALIGGVLSGEKDSKAIGYALAGAGIGFLLGNISDSYQNEHKKKRGADIRARLKDIDEATKLCNKLIKEATNATPVLEPIPSPWIDLEKMPNIIVDVEAVPVRLKVEKKETGNMMQAQKLQEMTFRTLNLKEPYRAFIGDPEEGFSAVVYGLPGAGKSTFCVQLANHLAENHGKTLFVSSEEGYGVTMQSKLKKVSEWLIISDLKDKSKLKDIVKDSRARFVFIDSINHMKISHDELETLKNQFKDVSFIGILQATKQGNFKGEQEFAHNADIIIQVEKGMAHSTGRFSPSGTLKLF